jgi:hypothetical protein
MPAPLLAGAAAAAVTGTVAYTHRLKRQYAHLAIHPNDDGEYGDFVPHLAQSKRHRLRMAVRRVREQVLWWQHSELGNMWEHILGLVAMFSCGLYVGGIRCVAHF